MTEQRPAIRVFVPEDWDALCRLYERAATCEMALSGTGPSTFRPMAEEEDRQQFPCPGFTSIQRTKDVVLVIA